MHMLITYCVEHIAVKKKLHMKTSYFCLKWLKKTYKLLFTVVFKHPTTMIYFDKSCSSKTNTSSDLSCRNPHTHAATETGETKKSGMKTKSQKCEPLSTRSHTRTSKVSRSRWMPTAISMALNSTHVSPSALKNTIYIIKPT